MAYIEKVEIECRRAKCQFHEGHSEPDEDWDGDGTCVHDRIEINLKGECTSATDITLGLDPEEEE